MKTLSRVTDLDGLMNAFRSYVRHRFGVKHAFVICRHDLASPFYRVWQPVTPCGDTNVTCPTADVRKGGLLSRLLYDGIFQQLTDWSLTPDDSAADLLRDERNLMAIPLFENGTATDMVILLGPWDAPREEDLCELTMMSGLLHTTIRTHGLAKEMGRAHEALDRELRRAAEVQSWLLPSTVPIISGVSVAASYHAAHHAGGDYYDVVELPDGRLGLLIADVSGKGAPAAVLMAVVRTAVRLEIEWWTHPAFLLANVNRHLCDLGLSDHGAFVTAVCGILDANTRQFIHSSAGHHPPRLVSVRHDQVVGLDDANSPPLGVKFETQYNEQTVHLQSGDMLLFYTDGIVDASSPQGDRFEIRRLDQVLKKLPIPPSPRAAIADVMQAVSRFTGPGSASDDQTLIAVSVKEIHDNDR
ncbi:MAG: PP2C family protein-serine/threonine phosphatase [Phycisphaeraceae bacterium]